MDFDMLMDELKKLRTMLIERAAWFELHGHEHASQQTDSAAALIQEAIDFENEHKL